MQSKAIRCNYEITYTFKGLCRHITVKSITAKENFLKSMGEQKSFKMIACDRVGKRKGESKRFW